ncbi:MAG: signal peptidase I [Chloroflexota bacterium]|mgnify:CR=1 FL=1
MTQRPALGCLFEIVETLVLTLVIFFVIQNFVAQPYQVKQQSMERTLEPNEYVLVDKLTPRFSAYERGSIIVFTPPPDWSPDDGTPFIKRIVGIGGDSIEIVDGRVHVNDVAIDEPYLYTGTAGPEPTTTTIDPPRWEVPAGELFVMGDHRSHSADSRAFGPIPVDSVVGRAWLRYWPFGVFGILDSPTYPGLQIAVP